MEWEMAWGELDQIFGAYVRQETLENAAREMAENAETYPELRATFDNAIADGLQRAEAGDIRSCQSVENSGYYAKTPNEAANLIRELQALFSNECARRGVR